MMFGVEIVVPFLIFFPRRIRFFAALGNYRSNPWFVNFVIRLLEGSPQVLKLIEKNPFPNTPPRYIRAVLYEYRFTDFKTRKRAGNWWKRKYKGIYLPPVELKKG